MRWKAQAAAVVVTGILGLTAVACGGAGASPGGSGPTTYTACDTLPQSTKGLLAVTMSGSLDAIDPATLHLVSLADHVLADGGVAVRPELDWAYVTSVGPNGRPGIWAVSISGCHARSSLVEADAELPAVSPDGGHLAYVTLDHKGRQTGVAIVDLGATGQPDAPVRRFPASSLPPALPITGVALGADSSALAVWGGFVDSYLGRAHPTVGTLDPATATSLADLTPVFDEEGISIAAPPPRNQKPEDWQSAPTYLPNGEFLVGDNDRDIVMPFKDTTPGVSGGGIRLIDSGVGPIGSLAAGLNGSIAWVGTDHRLSVARDAVDLPFGPQAETAPRQSLIPTRVVQGRFTSVAWAIPPSEAPPAVAAFHIVAHLPNVVGLSEATATSTMAALDLPVFIGHAEVNPTVPTDTVLAQDPPAGDGVACQCSVTLTVSTQG